MILNWLCWVLRALWRGLTETWSNEHQSQCHVYSAYSFLSQTAETQNIEINNKKNYYQNYFRFLLPFSTVRNNKLLLKVVAILESSCALYWLLLPVTNPVTTELPLLFEIHTGGFIFTLFFENDGTKLRS